MLKLYDDWRDLVDAAVMAEQSGHTNSIDERAIIAIAANSIADTVPENSLANILFRHVLENYVGILDGFDINSCSSDLREAPDIYTMGRAAYFKIGDCSYDSHKISVSVCVALHEGDRSLAVDGLFLLGNLKAFDSNYFDAELARFFEQSLSHLSTMLDIFPDPKVNRVLDWILKNQSHGFK